jgi:hypothetical protein
LKSKLGGMEAKRVYKQSDRGAVERTSTSERMNDVESRGGQGICNVTSHYFIMTGGHWRGCRPCMRTIKVDWLSMPGHPGLDAPPQNTCVSESGVSQAQPSASPQNISALKDIDGT